MTRRRRARELALKILYVMEMRKDSFENIFDDLISIDELDTKYNHLDDIRKFSLLLVEYVQINKDKLDSIISRISENWSFARINILDKNILRIGIAEILFMDDIPGNVTIDEAVEIAKKYSTEKSGIFINGILDKVFKESVFSEHGGNEKGKKILNSKDEA